MKKSTLYIVLAMLCLIFEVKAQSQPILLTGQVSDPGGKAIPNATVQIKGEKTTAFSNAEGRFIIRSTRLTGKLTVSHIGYETVEFDFNSNSLKPFNIILKEDNSQLKEIEIVSTGYQNIPKERATGSFTTIDNKLLNRVVSPDLLSRLKGVANGLLFDDSSLNPLGISIRGRSTLFSNTQPLVVVDNFPFEGNLNSLDPNDIENVTILKDAAAASIWGTRSGNGVIVITTKKGLYNQSMTVTGNMNVTVKQKPDLYFQDQLTSNEFIDLEMYLYDKGKNDAAISNGYSSISPVVNILRQQSLGELTIEEANAQINRYRGFDIRDQLGQYYYRKSVGQQYSFNVRGGGTKQNYFLSGGYDSNGSSIVGQSSDRFTLKGNNIYMLLPDQLTISTDLTFSTSRSKSTNPGYRPYLPYDQIADESGNALPVMVSNGLREQFTDTVGNGKLLDWKYRPLDELHQKYNEANDNETDYRVNIGLNYKILKSLALSANYQYYRANGENQDYSSVESFSARNLINSPSYTDELTGQLVRPIPLGGTLSVNNRLRASYAGRVQLDFNKQINENHEINALGGYEIREDKSDYRSTFLYGYDRELATHMAVDQTATFPNLYGSGVSGVNKGSQYWAVDRNISFFVNGTYSYKGKYILSGSFRKDESNLFGVKANQKGVPLWSGGLAWNLHKEPFLKKDWLNTLKLRTTYGFNGNVNKDITAYLTSALQSYPNTYGQNFSLIENPPNDNLRWERVENFNIGLDFSLKQNTISGNLDFFIKNGENLIGNSPVAPQTGILEFTGNVAGSHTKGIDFQLYTLNINSTFKWSTNFIYNYVKDKIANYQAYTGSNLDVVTNSLTPIVGYPLNAVFAYKWGGLDVNGNPTGVLKGETSSDYSNLLNSKDLKDLTFFGSAAPTHYGSVRNTFSYKSLELSFNLTYKGGYFIRRNALSYFGLFNGAYVQPDFNDRWQKPGDEAFTNVPGMNYPYDSSAATFYKYASVMVENGGHIRLQDLQLGFNLSNRTMKRLPFSNLGFYAYAANLGIIWKSAAKMRDPDIRSGLPNPLSVSFGVKTEF